MLIRNTIANFAGQLLYPVLALALVPFYLRHVGIEGYGLIGLITMVVSVLGVFSRGLGSALQREFGRRSATDEARRSLPALLSSFEVVYWIAGGVFAVALAALALTVGPRWIRAETIPQGTVTACLVLLAARVALAFPHSVYQVSFIGTERQVQGNVLNALLALCSAAVGVTAILWFGGVLAFFAGEVLTAAVFLIVFRVCAFGVLPSGPRSFDASEVRSLLGASADLMWTNGIGLLISNVDRILISVLFPVAALGLYTAAVSAARAVSLGLNPFLLAAYPRTCRVAAAGSRQQQVDELLRTAAVVGALGAAIALPLCAFSVDVLRLWLGDQNLARAGAPIVSIYALGSLAIGFATVLYQWQMAAGATRYGARFNTVALLACPLMLWLLVRRYGLAGAAASWLVYALAALAYHTAVTFGPARLGAAARLDYVRVVATAVVPVAAVVILARLAADRLFPTPEGRLAALLAASVVSACWGARALFARTARGIPRMMHT